MNLAHAPRGGAEVFGRHYNGGQWLPFYVPRPAMPQVDEMDLTRMIADLFATGVQATFEAVHPKELRAHQRVDHAKARSMPNVLMVKPVIVSRDSYIVDGNHRWWAHVHHESEAMLVIRVDLPFDDAVAWLLKQPYVYTLTPTTPERN